MRILLMRAFAAVAIASTGLSAQERPEASPQRAAQKEACQRDARLIYRTGSNMAEDVRERILAARKEHIRDCMAKGSGSAG